MSETRRVERIKPKAIWSAYYARNKWLWALYKRAQTTLFWARRRDSTKKSPDYSGDFFGIRRRPTLPGRYQPSTIGTEGLNFCVRYGNRCDPFVITTGNGSVSLRTLTTAQLQDSRPFVLFFPAIAVTQSLSTLDSCSRGSIRRAKARMLPPIGSRSYLKSSPRPISIIKLHTLPYFHR